VGTSGTGNARSVAPPEPAIELPMDMRAVFEGWGAHLALRAGIEVDMMLGSQRLPYSIETLMRPSTQLAKPRDGAPIMAGTNPVIGGLELPS
jgi:hypothetical protein